MFQFKSVIFQEISTTILSNIDESWSLTETTTYLIPKIIHDEIIDIKIKQVKMKYTDFSLKLKTPSSKNKQGYIQS